MRAILDVTLQALDLFSLLIIVSVVSSWLVAFNVLNMRNNIVRALVEGLYRVTEPAMRPIRRRLPDFGGMDLSPVVLLLLIMLIERVINYYIYPYVF
jgi:YggT family protein